MANSFSNLFTIALAACGYLEARRQNLPQRYLAGYIVRGLFGCLTSSFQLDQGVALVGIGSFAFHASLLYEAQLADELPMIYVGSMSLWLIFDDEPGFDLQRSRTKWMIFLLLAFDVLFTLS